MPAFSAKDVQTLRQSTASACSMPRRPWKKTTETSTRQSHGCGSTAWPARPSGPTGRRPRGQWPSGVPAGPGGVDRAVAVGDRLRGQVGWVRRLVSELADLVAADGESALETRAADIEDMRTRLGENISIGKVVLVEAPADGAVDSYLHLQAGRGVNAVVVAVSGGSAELAHDVAAHIAFARPTYISRDEVPEEDVAAELETVEKIARTEGKPDAALPKIIEGRLNGWYKERVLLDQAYIKDEKKTVAKFLGAASVTQFAQVVIGD